jgi:uncharacterized protein YbjT (DUF2867 family)
MKLVCGATGQLGAEICRQLLRSGETVRALVREHSDARRVESLRIAGPTVVYGDLKAPKTIEQALTGVHYVISTASSTVSRGDGDSIQSVDLDGHLRLIEAACRAKVRQIVYVSFFNIDLDFPLQTAKRVVEKALKSSGITYTILQPAYFMEAWLGPALGFDPVGGRVRMLGDGLAHTSWISLKDVARIAANCIENPGAKNQTFPLGGPEALSYHDVLETFRAKIGSVIDVETVPTSELENQYASAGDPMDRSFAALRLGAARGMVVSSAAALQVVPVPLTTIEEYAASVVPV